MAVSGRNLDSLFGTPSAEIDTIRIEFGLPSKRHIGDRQEWGERGLPPAVLMPQQ
jgi:hypothetical protein